MKTTIQWLDEAKARHGLSDYALAPRLGVGKGQISRYRNGLDFLSDDAALKLAQLLEVDPRLVIASAHAERSKSPEAREFWRRWAAAAVAAAAFIGGPGGPPPAHSMTTPDSDCYVKRRRRSALQSMADTLKKTADGLAGLLVPLTLRFA